MTTTIDDLLVPRTDEPLTAVSLYAGAGGMDLGFHAAGIHPVWVNENNAHALTTNKAMSALVHERMNHGGEVEYTGDSIDCVDETSIPHADIVVGGPPCQGFSVAGKQDPDDPRSRQVHRFMDVVGAVMPRAFVMENVPNLATSPRYTGVRHALRSKADKLGYAAEFHVLNSADYGAPQARKRVFFIGFLDGDPLFPTPPTRDLVTIRQALNDFDDPYTGYRGSIITPTKNPIVRKNPYTGYLFNGGGKPLNLDKPSITVPASSGNSVHVIDQEWLDDPTATPWVDTYLKHLHAGGAPVTSIPDRLRRATPGELSRLQGFPDWMPWHGPVTAVIRQIGNAVPPLLAEAVATSVRKRLT